MPWSQLTLPEAGDADAGPFYEVGVSTRLGVDAAADAAAGAAGAAGFFGAEELPASRLRELDSVLLPSAQLVADAPAAGGGKWSRPDLAALREAAATIRAGEIPWGRASVPRALHSFEALCRSRKDPVSVRGCWAFLVLQARIFEQLELWLRASLGDADAATCGAAADAISAEYGEVRASERARAQDRAARRLARRNPRPRV